VTILGDDGHFYYYAHNSENLVAEGDVVVAGQAIALVGNTGNARTTPPHVHLGISVGGSTFSEARAVNPYPLLVAAVNGEPLPPVAIEPTEAPPPPSATGPTTPSTEPSTEQLPPTSSTSSTSLPTTTTGSGPTTTSSTTTTTTTPSTSTADSITGDPPAPESDEA
jgi:hypothetical protein